MPNNDLDSALLRRLPTASATLRSSLAKAYQDGVLRHAVERTTGSGPIPTTLSAERADLLAFVSRALGRLLTEDEVAALLRIPTATARSLRKVMLAVYDDLPALGLQTAFDGANRVGRGSQGDVNDGYRVKFSSEEKLEIAEVELARQGFASERSQDTGARRVLYIDAEFPINSHLPAG